MARQAMIRAGAMLGAVTLALLAAGCSPETPPTTDPELRASVEAFVGLEPPRSVDEVTQPGTVTDTCVDAIGDLWETVGIDIDTVQLAREDGFVTARWTLASITNYVRPNAVQVSSIRRINAGVNFEIRFRPSDDPGRMGSVDVQFGSPSGWKMSSWGGRDKRVTGGDFVIVDDKIVEMRVPESVFPEGQFDWSAYLLYDHNKKDFCPGIGRDEHDGWLTMPQSS